MRVNLKVLVLSVVCDDLLYAKVWRKLKVEFAKVFFCESFAQVVRYDWNIHGFLKMKFI